VGEYLKDLDIKDIDGIVLLEDSKNLQEESFIIEIAMIKEKIKKNKIMASVKHQIVENHHHHYEMLPPENES
jgi:hypothetical protein